MYPPNPGKPAATLFSWGLDISQVHWLILALALPFYVVMVVCLRDPPPPTVASHSLRESFKGMWTMLCTKAMFMMIFFNIFFVALAGLQNPATSSLVSIIEPTPLLMSLSSLLGQLLFILGVWIFRNYFMQTNWRFTCGWTHVMTALEAAF